MTGGMKIGELSRNLNASITSAAYNAATDTLTLTGANLCPKDGIVGAAGSVDCNNRAANIADKTALLGAIKDMTIGGIAGSAWAVSSSANYFKGSAGPASGDLEAADNPSGVSKVAVKADGTQIAIKFLSAKVNAAGAFEAASSGTGGKFAANGATSATDGIKASGASSAATKFGLTTSGLAVTVSGYVALTAAITYEDTANNQVSYSTSDGTSVTSSANVATVTFTSNGNGGADTSNVATNNEVGACLIKTGGLTVGTDVTLAATDLSSSLNQTHINAMVTANSGARTIVFTFGAANSNIGATGYNASNSGITPTLTATGLASHCTTTIGKIKVVKL